MTNYGAEFHVIQFVNVKDIKQKLQNLKNNQHIENIDDLSAESVLKKIFLVIEYSVNDAFKKHFEINDIKANFKKYQHRETEKEKEENSSIEIEMKSSDKLKGDTLRINDDDDEEEKLVKNTQKMIELQNTQRNSY
eukprot:158121_1